MKPLSSARIGLRVGLLTLVVIVFFTITAQVFLEIGLMGHSETAIPWLNGLTFSLLLGVPTGFLAGLLAWGVTSPSPSCKLQQMMDGEDAQVHGDRKGYKTTSAVVRLHRI